VAWNYPGLGAGILCKPLPYRALPVSQDFGKRRKKGGGEKGGGEDGIGGDTSAVVHVLIPIRNESGPATS